MTFSIRNLRHLAVTRRSHRLALAALATILLGLVPTVVAAQGNSIVVESKTVLPGQDSVWVAVWLSNAVPIELLYVVLELREISVGTFPRPLITLDANPNGRLNNSSLGSDDPECWPYPWSNPTVDRAGDPDVENNWCSGPLSNSYSHFYGDPLFLSPEAYALVALGTCGSMPPGSDPKDPDSSSIRFLINTPEIAGEFEIDTCCFLGAHTVYIHDSDRDSVVPVFTKGVITVCDCRCQGNPNCDTTIDVSDVVLTINRAFRGESALADPNCIGHVSGTVDGRTDIDCSNTTDIVDVVRMIGAAFRGDDVEPCNGCTR